MKKALLILAVLLVCISIPASGFTAKEKKGEKFADAYKRLMAEAGALPVDDEKQSQKKLKAYCDIAQWAARRYLWKESDAAYEEVLQSDPEHKEARRELDYMMFKDEWYQSIQAYKLDLEEGVKAGRAVWMGKFIPTEQMEALRAVERRKHGWDFNCKDVTQTFTIYSNLDPVMTHRIKRLTIQLWIAFHAEWGKFIPLKMAIKMPVFIAKDRDDFQVIVAKKMGYGSRAFGFFSPQTKMAFFHLYKGDYDTLAAVFAHELTHALSFRGMKQMSWPKGFWFVEGWSQYSEYSVWDNDTIRYGTIRMVDIPAFGGIKLPNKLERLQDAIYEGGIEPMEEFLDMSQRGFMSGEVGLHYAQAWALFYFLNHYDDCKYKAQFIKFLQLCCKGKSNADTFKKRFGLIEPIEKEFMEWLEDLEENYEKPERLKETPTTTPVEETDEQ